MAAVPLPRLHCIHRRVIRHTHNGRTQRLDALLRCGASRDCCELQLRRTVRVCHVTHIDHRMTVCQLLHALHCGTRCMAAHQRKGNALIHSAMRRQRLPLRDAIAAHWSDYSCAAVTLDSPAHDHCARPAIETYACSDYRDHMRLESTAYTAPTGRRRARSAAPGPPRCRRDTRSSLRRTAYSTPHRCGTELPTVGCGPNGCGHSPVW